MDQHELFEDTFNGKIAELSKFDINSDEFATGVKSLRVLSEVRPTKPEPEPLPDPVPTTWYGKLWAGICSAADSETTRTIIKVSGPLAAVGLVTYTTIHKDHVLERNALAQANQSPAK